MEQPNYVDIDDLVVAIGDLLAGLGVFKDVVYSTATDTGQLLEEMEAASPPAAIVGIGEIEYDERGIQRTLKPLVVIVDAFRRGGKRRCESVWTLAKAAEGLFQARPGNGGFREILGIEFTLAGVRPLALSGALAAVAITLEGVEFV